jgi:hypothetical protein
MILERIARYADIDTRRALGIYTALPKTDFIPRPIPSQSWRYWPEKRKAIFFNARPENNEYEFEIHTGLVYTGEFWTYTQDAQVRSMMKIRNRYIYNEHSGVSTGLRFQFGCQPDFV